MDARFSNLSSVLSAAAVETRTFLAHSLHRPLAVEGKPFGLKSTICVAPT
jgi:hypothetical protein